MLNQPRRLVEVFVDRVVLPVKSAISEKLRGRPVVACLHAGAVGGLFNPVVSGAAVLLEFFAHIQDAGLEVPRDLSVIGYDDIEIAEYLGLTTIRQQLFESGVRGVELLLETLDTPPSEPVCDVLPAELVVRDTTAPCV
jgi:hypothetical protein